MISLKTKEEAKKMRRSGEIAAFAINQLVREVRVGITTLELDKIAKRLIEARGAKSAFLDYNGYNYTICVSINDEVVHGLPSSRQIKDGDIVSIDLGVLYNGYFADTAKSVIVGNATVEAKRVVFGVKEALEAAIKEARPYPTNLPIYTTRIRRDSRLRRAITPTSKYPRGVRTTVVIA